MKKTTLKYFLFGFAFFLTFTSFWLWAAEFPKDQTSESLAKILVKSEYIFTSAPFASCHASTIAEAADGTLVTAWFGGTAEGNGDVAIWSSWNKDGKWSTPKIAADAELENIPCWNPVLFQPKDGPMRLFYKTGKIIAQWQGEMVTSYDNGQTWKDRIILPEHFIGPVKNKPVQLADGTILCPTSTEHDGWRIHVEQIPDFDKTWSRTDALNKKSEGGAIQPSILFHQDGRLQMICRNKDAQGKLWQIWSKDNGRTWGKMSLLDLPNPCSGTDAVTLRDGRQLLVYNHTNTKTGGRNILNVAVSKDGVHWKAVCVLENQRGEFSYPAVIQTKDGKVHIVYTWSRKRIKHIVIDPEKIDGITIENGRWPDALR